MIARQRSRHFWMWAILGPLAIAVFLAAMFYRQEPAIGPVSPDERLPTAPAGGGR